MILFAICLFIAIVSLVLIILHNTQCIPPLPNAVQLGAVTGMFLGAIVSLCLIGCYIINVSQANARLETYDTLILYRDVVEASNDELLRYDFYERVQKWNERYESHLKTRENNWISMVDPARGFENCDFVKFELRRS